jgi:hypothetical protein
MSRWPILLAALAAATALATGARAADTDTVADTRCLVAALALTQSTDPQVKAAAPAAALYFVGRLDGRAPDLDLEAAVIKQVNGMSPDDLRGELHRCGGILQGRGEKLKQIGADLQKIEDQAGAGAPPK